MAAARRCALVSRGKEGAGRELLCEARHLHPRSPPTQSVPWLKIEAYPVEARHGHPNKLGAESNRAPRDRGPFEASPALCRLMDRGGREMISR